MIEYKEPENNWEILIKGMLSRLDISSKQDITRLHERLDRLEQLLCQSKPLGTLQKEGAILKPSGKPGKPKKRKSASSTVLEIFASYPEGTNFKTIKAATGYNDKKLRNIIFRLDNIKKIERVTRGIYRVSQNEA